MKNNKTVLITGASHGIGKAIAKIFAENNYRIIINYNKSNEDAKNLESYLKSIGCDCIAIQANVADESSVISMIRESKKFTNKIDVLVNNAGIALSKLLCDTTVKEWNTIMNTNITGTFNCCKYIVPEMIKNRCGKIINISSIWGIYGASMEVAYSTSKAAIIGFTKALSKELGPSNINVNCVAPGVIDTKMNSNLSDSDIEEIKNATSLGCIGTPKDIAETVLFLASESSNFITGQVISPNGGFPI